MYALVLDCLLLQPFVPRACISGRKAGVKPFPARILGLFQNSKDSAYFDNRLLGIGQCVVFVFQNGLARPCPVRISGILGLLAACKCDANPLSSRPFH